MTFSTPNIAKDASAKTYGKKSVDPKSIEAMERFARESGPKIVEGLNKLHREKYPELYRDNPSAAGVFDPAEILTEVAPATVE
jgi:hypothetical protein